MTFVFIKYLNHYTIRYTFEISTTRLGEKEMKMITLHLPTPYIEDLDKLVKNNYYPNRAEAIRAAVRDLLADELWERRGIAWERELYAAIRT